MQLPLLYRPSRSLFLGFLFHANRTFPHTVVCWNDTWCHQISPLSLGRHISPLPLNCPLGSLRRILLGWLSFFTRAVSHGLAVSRREIMSRKDVLIMSLCSVIARTRFVAHDHRQCKCEP